MRRWSSWHAQGATTGGEEEMRARHSRRTVPSPCTTVVSAAAGEQGRTMSVWLGRSRGRSHSTATGKWQVEESVVADRTGQHRQAMIPAAPVAFVPRRRGRAMRVTFALRLSGANRFDCPRAACGSPGERSSSVMSTASDRSPAGPPASPHDIIPLFFTHTHSLSTLGSTSTHSCIDPRVDFGGGGAS